jgi:hypothetical protein
MASLTRQLTTAAFVLAFAACSANPPQSEWEIHLVEGENCGACDLFDEIREQRGVGDWIETDMEGMPRRVPVRTVSPDKIDDDDLNAMERLPYLTEREARELAAGNSLLVIVRHEDQIKAAGNIAWSSDLMRARYPDSVMAPPASGPFDDLVKNPSGYYREYFEEEWSLAHFLELALDPSKAFPHGFTEAYSPSAASGDYALDEANVFIAASADTPAGNPFFIPQRIREIRDRLNTAVSVPSSRIETFYGDGGGKTNDTSVNEDGELAFRAVNLGGERSLDGQALIDWFAALERQQTRRNLIIQVGHGGPSGMPIWGHLAELTPHELRLLHERSDARNVLVSGACFGGVFAKSLNCGFFAARPDVVAAGCQRTPEAVAQSDDYLRWYFRSLAPAYKNEADADDDGEISFREAHWFAATRLEHDQLPYSTLDALAEHHFAGSGDRLPETVTLERLHQMAGKAPPPERAALARLTDGQDSDREISLADPAGQKREAGRKLKDLGSARSTARNEAMDLPYRLALVQLARRLIYREQSDAADLVANARVDACESETFRRFLR